MTKSRLDIHGGVDAAQAPRYGIADAAHFLSLPAATVRAWVCGRSYPTDSGKQFSKPLVRIADEKEQQLSFQNLVEVYVLGAIRRRHEVKMSAIRSALQYLGREFGSKHPLAEQQMLTDGTSLLVEKYGRLINASKAGQLEMHELLERSLERIDRDPAGLPLRLYPFTSLRLERDRRPVAIDPRIQFGRPCLAGTGIPTDVLFDRWRAGDSIAEIAADYAQPASVVEEALRYEDQSAAA